MTDHINDKYIKVNLSLYVYVVRGLLERAPQVVFKTELTCLIISIINRFRRILKKISPGHLSFTRTDYYSNIPTPIPFLKLTRNCPSKSVSRSFSSNSGMSLKRMLKSILVVLPLNFSILVKSSSAV